MPKFSSFFIYFSMNFLFKGELIDYYFFDFNKNNNETIVFLHGWGGNKNSFKSTINLLKHKFNILAVTMPTIANTAVAWSLVDYANLILALCKLHDINSIYVVCHSFGFWWQIF